MSENNTETDEYLQLVIPAAYESLLSRPERYIQAVRELKVNEARLADLFKDMNARTHHSFGDVVNVVTVLQEGHRLEIRRLEWILFDVLAAVKISGGRDLPGASGGPLGPSTN